MTNLEHWSNKRFILYWKFVTELKFRWKIYPILINFFIKLFTNHKITREPDFVQNHTCKSPIHNIHTIELSYWINLSHTTCHFIRYHQHPKTKPTIHPSSRTTPVRIWIYVRLVTKTQNPINSRHLLISHQFTLRYFTFFVISRAWLVL